MELEEAADEAILARALLEKRTIVTLDADFHTLLALEQASKPSVIRIRIEGLRSEALAVLLQKVVALCGDEIEAGAMISVQENRIRVRRLPVQ